MRSLPTCRRLAALLIFFASAGAGLAQTGEPSELTPALARKLLSQALDVIESEVDVVYVLDGEKAVTKGFSSSSAAAVIYLATRVEDGHRRRRCHEQIFLYSSEFGWFLEEVVEEEFRDYFRLWTEKKGYLEFK